MRIGKYEFNMNNHHYIMGILNLSPESFGDGGKYSQLDNAFYRLEEMIEEGADIIDIGGQSTRPGYKEITPEEEIERLVPVLSGIKERFDIPISLDTYKSRVARELVPFIDMVNDVRGLDYDGLMGEVIAKNELSCCIMAHKIYKECSTQPMGGNLQSKGEEYIDCVIDELKEGLHRAEEAGIPKDRIILDGGVGFGKDYNQNLYTIHHTSEIALLGYPVLMATSNKGFMREITGNIKKSRRDETVTTTVMGAMLGAKLFRVHDVASNKKALQVYEAITQEKMPNNI